MPGHYDHRSDLCRRLGADSLQKVPEYLVWIRMRNRCSDPERKRYAGRGISVCARWQSSFEAFLDDMGPRPSQRHSIDRIDNNGNYEPGNCRWAVPVVQANNKSSNHLVTYRGEEMSLRDAVRAAGDVVGKATVWRRLLRDWPVHKAVETPANPKCRNHRFEVRRKAA
ncbi:hypothetical protein NKJ71_19615 [Mesorhizobium sp. M0050]|uniref:hypothetical protein n=1 Tax=Mesorhizobium sp. M0050 TaxID=2956861 RepID=UPI00333B6EEB